MTALALYSTDADPQLLYSTDDYDRPVDEQLRGFVRTGGSPLDLFVDFGSRRILWLCKAKRKTTSTRTGYFVADYHGPWDEDLFAGFEAALRTLHDSEDWALPYQADAQWDAGFNLWRVDSSYPDMGQQAAELFRSTLETATDPAVFGMAGHHSAYRLISALEADDAECTVAVGGATETTADLVLDPTSDTDLTPRSPSADACLGGHQPTGHVAQPMDSDDETFERNSVGSRIAGAVLLIVLGLSAFSFVSVRPIHPISGLGAIGGLLGTLLGYAVLLGDPTDPAISLERLVARSQDHTDRSLVVLAYGTTLGFTFPTIFRIGGQVVIGETWLFGSVARLGGALLSALAFGGLLFGLNYGLLTAFPRSLPGVRVGRDRLAAAHGCYALVILLLTGLSRALWFSLIPSA